MAGAPTRYREVVLTRPNSRVCGATFPKTLPHNYQKFMTALRPVPILTSD